MPKNVMKVVTGLAGVGAVAVSGAALASSQGTVGSLVSGTQSQTQNADSMGPQGHGGHNHTSVTGAEKTKVADAVKAKDAAVSVKDVLKDADGSYDVFGTKSGSRVMVEVSKDLKTITVRTGGPGDGHGGHGRDGGHDRTPVTGSEKTKVVSAIKAKDSAVTVEFVGKDADGSYDAFGMKSGSRVMVEVSKDLKTITVRTGAPDGFGHRGGEQGGHAGQQTPGGSSGSTSGTTGSGTTSGTSSVAGATAAAV